MLKSVCLTPEMKFTELSSYGGQAEQTDFLISFLKKGLGKTAFQGLECKRQIHVSCGMTFVRKNETTPWWKTSMAEVVHGVVGEDEGGDVLVAGEVCVLLRESLHRLAQVVQLVAGHVQ